MGGRLDLFKKTLSLESVAASTSTRKFGLLQQRTSASVVARVRSMVRIQETKTPANAKPFPSLNPRALKVERSERMSRWTIE